MKLFSGTIPTSTTLYVPLNVVDGTIGAYIAWLDATSSATITVELTSIPGVSPHVAGAAWHWKDSGETFTGPAATAAGALLVNIANARQNSARLKIVTAAACAFEIYDEVKS